MPSLMVLISCKKERAMKIYTAWLWHIRNWAALQLYFRALVLSRPFQKHFHLQPAALQKDNTRLNFLPGLLMLEMSYVAEAE